MDSLIQFLIGGLIQGCVFAMLALGFSLVFRVTGVINLAQGAFCVLGPMAMQILEAAFHAPVWLAAPGGLVVSTALAVGIGSVSFVPAVSRLSTSSSLILTAGLLTFLDGLIFVIWGNEPYALPGFSGTPPFIVGAIRIPSQSVWLLGTCGILLVSIWYLLQRTGLGRALRACAENPMAARLMGIDVRRMTLVSFGMAAFVGCLTGIMVAPITALQFDTGDFFTMSGFIAVAIGGIGNLAGSVIGGVFLGLTQQLAAGYISTLFANTLALALLIVVLLVRPAGLFAVGTRRRTDVREAQAVHRPLVRFDGPVSVGIGGVLFAVMAVLPLVPLPDGMIDSLLITLTLFIAVLGLDVLMGFAGQVSLGQSGFMALGGYAASILSVSYDWPPVASMGAALAISCAIGASLAIVTTRIRGLYLALATLAFRAVGGLAAGRACRFDRRPVGPGRHSIAGDRFRSRSIRRIGCIISCWAPARCWWSACSGACEAASGVASWRCGPTRQQRRRWV